MGKIILIDGIKYKIWKPKDEVRDFEPLIIEHIKDIFGDSCEYFPKQKMTTLANNRSIPDGFVVDFKNRRWYIVELKLLCDDAIRRIRDQIDDYKTAIQNIESRRQIYKAIRQMRRDYSLDDLINDTEPEIVIIIDSLDGEMGEQFKEKVNKPQERAKILEFTTFEKIEGNTPIISNDNHVFLFTPIIEKSAMTIHDVSVRRSIREVKRGQVTTQKRYVIPILESLIEVGGEESVKTLYNMVERRMKNILVAADYENLHTGEIRWKNAVRFARNSMVNKGLLDKNSPTGIWRITDKGREYYRQKQAYLNPQ